MLCQSHPQLKVPVAFLIETSHCSIWHWISNNLAENSDFDFVKYKNIVLYFLLWTFSRRWSHPQNWWQQHKDPNRLFGGYYCHSVGHHKNHTVATGLAEDDWEGKIITDNIILVINSSLKPALLFLSMKWLSGTLCNRKLYNVSNINPVSQCYFSIVVIYSICILIHFHLNFKVLVMFCDFVI